MLRCVLHFVILFITNPKKGTKVDPRLRWGCSGDHPFARTRMVIIGQATTDRVCDTAGVAKMRERSFARTRTVPARAGQAPATAGQAVVACVKSTHVISHAVVG